MPLPEEKAVIVEPQSTAETAVDSDVAPVPKIKQQNISILIRCVFSCLGLLSIVYVLVCLPITYL